MERILFSFDTTISFLKKCAQELDRTRGYLSKIGTIEVPNPADSWIRAKIFNHISFSTLFFGQRLDLFLESFKNTKINLDILETLFRGLIEIYSRTLFILNSPEAEAVKKIIWQDIYIIGLSNPNLARYPEVKNTIRIDYSILRFLRAEIPPINVIRKNVQAWLKGDAIDKKIKAMLKTNRFPGVPQMIRQYHHENEVPIIPRYFLIRSYSELSEQLHGNFLMEGFGGDQYSKYRIVAFLTLLTLKFMRTVSKKTRSEAEIDPLIKEFVEISVNYKELWRSFLRPERVIASS